MYGSLLLTSIICLMHTELLKDRLWCSVVAVSSVTLDAASWSEKKSVVKTWTKSHLSSSCFYWILCCPSAYGDLSYKNSSTRKLNIFAFLSSFLWTLDSFTLVYSPLYTQLPSSSFVRLHQLINCLERFRDFTDFKNWFLYQWGKFAFCIDLSRWIFLAEDSNVWDMA